MEDVLRVEHGLPGGFSYAAVLDGHGGVLSAEWLYDELYAAVAPLVTEQLLAPDDAPHAGAGAQRRLPGVRWPARAGAALSEAFSGVDARLLHFLRGEFGVDVMGVSGSTALVGLIHPTKALFASLGDCMAVVCRGGTAVRATQQHRVYGAGPDVLEELERVESTGAWVIDGRVCNVLAVSRAFGDPEFKGPGLKALLAEGARKGLWTPEFAATHTFTSDPVIVEPDVTEVVFEPGDEFLIMATDGLWDCMKAPEAVAYARKQFKKGLGAQEVARAMTGIALKRYTADNVAVVVVDLRRRGGGGSGGGGGGGSDSGSGSESDAGGSGSEGGSGASGAKARSGGGGSGGGLFGGLFGGR